MNEFEMDLLIANLEDEKKALTQTISELREKLRIAQARERFLRVRTSTTLATWGGFTHQLSVVIEDSETHDVIEAIDMEIANIERGPK